MFDAPPLNSNANIEDDDQPFSFENRRNSSSSNIFSQHFNPSSPTSGNPFSSSNANLATSPTSTTPTFGTLKEIKRTAAHAWCPGTSISSPMIATGTLSGAMDLSFSTSAQLEISELNLDQKATNEVLLKVSTSSHSRFNKLSWSSDGVIIGGLEDGSLNFWNVQALLENSTSSGKEPLFTKSSCHKGPVRGLEVNLSQANLVASGSCDQDISILDLNKLSHDPYAPSPSRSNKLEEVSDLSWNLQVPYILAAVSNSGYGVMWDLRARKEVIHIATPPSPSSSRTPLSCLSWNPDNAMHLLTASDDDSNPQIFSWDLRNSRAPEKILSGHKKGILSLSWNPKDSDLLLSSGKDQQVMCWNPRKGLLISDSLWSDSDNWLFDTQWCPQYPDIFSSASFGDVIRVHSFQTLLSSSIKGSHSSPSNSFSNPSSSSSSVHQSNSSSSQTIANSQIPKWLRRPVGVSFGPGGRLISFSSTSNPSIHSLKDIVTIGPLQKTLRDACLLDEALSTQKLSTFCSKEKMPSKLRGEDFNAVFWAVAKAIFTKDDDADNNVKYQDRMMNLLGFDKVGLEKRIRTLSNDCRERKRTRSLSGSQIPPLMKSSNITIKSPAPTVDEYFKDDSFGEDLLSPSLSMLNLQHPNNPLSPMKEFSLFNPSTTDEIDRLITRAIILGNFEAAVDLCVQSDRLSDALLVAVCGGPALVKKTQEDYFVRAPYPYLRLVSGIVKGDLMEVIEDASLEDWEELLAICCSFSSSSETFQTLCSTLGHRLLKRKGEEASYEEASIVCFMAAGHVKVACSTMLGSRNLLNNCNNDYYDDDDLGGLQSLVEKIRILEQIGHLLGASGDVSSLEVGEVSGPFERYAHFLSSFGLLPIADRYLSSMGDANVTDGTSTLAQMLSKMGIRQSSSSNSGFNDILNIPFNESKPVNLQQPQAPVSVMNQGFSQAPVSVMNQGFSQAPSHYQQPQYQQQSSIMAPPPPPSQIMVPNHTLLSNDTSIPSSNVPLYKNAGNYNDAPIIPVKRIIVPPNAAPLQPLPTATTLPPPPPPPSTTQYTPLPPLPPVVQPVMPIQPPQPLQSSLQHQSQFVQSSMSVPSPVPTPMPLMPTPLSLQSNSPPPPMPIVPQHTSLQQPLSPSRFAQATSIVNQSPPAQSLFTNVPPPPPVSMLSQTPPVFNNAPQQQQQSPQRSMSTSPVQNKIPFDESQLRGDDIAIHSTWKSLIEACKQRAMPMQKKIVEDSARKIDYLFLQLAASSGISNDTLPLSKAVKDLLLQMTNALIQRNYDLAHQLHLPLMTSHFGECGKWILAVKRLIEISKICLQ